MRRTVTARRWSRICASVGVVLVALTSAGCTAGGYGGTSGVVGGERTAAAPGPSLLDGVPAAAARTLSAGAYIAWRLAGARVFGTTHAPVYC